MQNLLTMGSSISKRMLGQVSRSTRFVPQQLSYNIVPLPYLKEGQLTQSQDDPVYPVIQVKNKISSPALQTIQKKVTHKRFSTKHLSSNPDSSEQGFSTNPVLHPDFKDCKCKFGNYINNEYETLWFSYFYLSLFEAWMTNSSISCHLIQPKKKSSPLSNHSKQKLSFMTTVTQTQQSSQTYPTTWPMIKPMNVFLKSPQFPCLTLEVLQTLIFIKWKFLEQPVLYRRQVQPCLTRNILRNTWTLTVILLRRLWTIICGTRTQQS